MKKICLIFLSMLFSINIVWGGPEYDKGLLESPSLNKTVLEKISDINKSEVKGQTAGLFGNNTVYFLSGFDFDKYTSNYPTLGSMTLYECMAINNGYGTTVTQAGTSYSVIGHSQGGLRALAHINQTKERYPDSLKKIDAVITISGIDQGFKALDGGLPAFKSRSADMVNIIGNGIIASASQFDVFFTPGVWLIPRNQAKNGLSWLLGVLPQTQGKFIDLIWNNANSKEPSQLLDMVPGSDYIKNNVVETVTTTVKRQVDTKLVIDIIIVWTPLPAPVPVPKLVPVYETYTVTQTTPKFDKSVPVGFITGTNNNTLSMLDSNEATVRVFIASFREGFRQTEEYHRILLSLGPGLFMGSSILAEDARKAKELLWTLPQKVNTVKRLRLSKIHPVQHSQELNAAGPDCNMPQCNKILTA